MNAEHIDSTEQESRDVQCPRCGYDLRGVIETWIDACPLEGTCSECGLGFPWCEVLRPELYEPRWCVEFSGGRNYLIAAAKTFGMSFRPWRFWSELKMTNQIHWRRLTAYLLLLLLPLLLAYVAEQSAVALRVRDIVYQQQLANQRQVRKFLSQNQQMLASAEASGTVSGNDLQGMRIMLKVNQAAAAAPATINQSRIQAIMEAIFFPWRSTSQGTVTSAFGTNPYPAPNQLHGMIFDALKYQWSWPLLNRRMRNRILVSVMVQWALLVGIPLGFLLLPVSRNVAKVRWGHIARVALYSLVLPVTLLCTLILLFSLSLNVSNLSDLFGSLSLRLIAHALWISLIIWWALAIRAYLKIPHGWLIAPALSLLTALMVLAVLIYGTHLILD